MMNLFRIYIVRPYLIIRYFFHWATRTGSFGPGQQGISLRSPNYPAGRAFRRPCFAIM